MVANRKTLQAPSAEDRAALTDYRDLAQSNGFQRLIHEQIKPRLQSATTELVWGSPDHPEILRTRIQVLYLLLKAVYEGAALPIPKEIQDLGKREEE